MLLSLLGVTPLSFSFLRPQVCAGGHAFALVLAKAHLHAVGLS